MTFRALRIPPPTTGFFTKINQKGGNITRGAVDTTHNTQYSVGGKAGRPDHAVSNDQTTVRNGGGKQHFHLDLVHGNSSQPQTGGSIYYGVSQEGGDGETFKGSYAPITRGSHTPQCGGRKTKRNVRRKRRTRQLKRRLTKHRKRRTRHHKKAKRSRMRRRRRRTRKVRQRGGGLAEEMEEAFRVHTGSGTHISGVSSDMTPGEQGRLASLGGYQPQKECFDNYNHFEAMSSTRQ